MPDVTSTLWFPQERQVPDSPLEQKGRLHSRALRFLFRYCLIVEAREINRSLSKHRFHNRNHFVGRVTELLDLTFDTSHLTLKLAL